MADLAAPTASLVKAVKVIELHSGPAGEAISAGQAVGMNAAGAWVLADADTGPILMRGLAVTSASLANITIDVMTKGLVDLGAGVLDAVACDALIYLSGTAGRLADAVVGGLAAIGRCWPAWGSTTSERLLRIDL